MNNPRRILGTSFLVTAGVGYLAGVSRGDDLPTARFVIGTGIAFTICSIMVDMGLDVGAAFGALIMISALFWQGEDAFRLLGARAKKTVRRRGRRRRERNGQNS